MVRRSALFLCVFGFAAGITLFELWGASTIVAVGLAIGLCLSVGVAFFKRSAGAAFLIFVIIAALGVGRGWLSNNLRNRPTPLDPFIDEKITVVGVVGEEQERRDHNTRLTVLVREINGARIEKEIKTLVTTNNPKDFRYGDLVQVSGKVSLPENFFTDTGRVFDYVSYLQANGVRFLIKNASVEILGRDPPSNIVAGLFAAKRAFVGSIQKMLPEPDSSLAAGILIDGKQSINGELQEKFRKTGLIHIVVLSGSNVSIVAEAISKACMFLPRMLGLASASLGIVAFAVITGASATVVRASIMALIVIASKMLIRNYDAGRGLFAASFLMLLHNPSILFYSPSFQLSFLATFAVIYVVPAVEWWATFFEYLPERFGIRELVTSNIVVQAFLFPILSWMTGFVSAVSLPVNLLVLPLVPITMLLSFLTAMTGLLSWPFAFASHALLTYELAVVDFFSKFSLAEIPVSGFSTIIVCIFYVCSISLCLLTSVDLRRNLMIERVRQFFSIH